MILAILTPTYNREKTLPRLYKSLIENKNNNHILTWYIMDDGSTDNTKELIMSYIKENIIPIKYFYQKNQGKMVALNNLTEYVEGGKTDIIVEIDSDDYATNEFYETIIDKWPLIDSNEKISGLLFRKMLEDKSLIGNDKLRNNTVSTIFDLYQKKCFEGDTCLVFKASVRLKYKHYLYEGEKFATEGTLYHQIDKNYDGLLCFNKPIIVCEYQADGYTKNIDKIFVNSPQAHYKYFKEMFDFDFKKMPFKKRLYIIKHYILFSYLTKRNKIEVIKVVNGKLNKFITSILVIPGYIKSRLRYSRR